MKTALQSYGTALATATTLGIRPLGSSSALYLTTDEAKRMFALEGFNTRTSKAWKEQMMMWEDLGYASVSASRVLFYNPPFSGIHPADSEVILATELVRTYTRDTGLPVIGWEA